MGASSSSRVQQNDFAAPDFGSIFSAEYFFSSAFLENFRIFVPPLPVKISFCRLKTEFFLMSRNAFKHILILKCMVFRFIIRKRQSHVLPDLDEGLSASWKK